jgi:hypothetical protein
MRRLKKGRNGVADPKSTKNMAKMAKKNPKKLQKIRGRVAGAK